MKLNLKIADFTLRNLIEQLDAIFSSDSGDITYEVKDENENIHKVTVEGWEKLKNEIKTDFLPINDIKNILKDYISFIDNIKLTGGIPSEDDIDDNRIVINKDTRAIYTKNQFGDMVESLNKDTVDRKLSKLLKNNKQIIFGEGEPNNSFGLNNTLYLDTKNANIYYKSNNEWHNLVKDLERTSMPVIKNIRDVIEVTDTVFNIENYDKQCIYNVSVNVGTVSLNVDNGTITYNSGKVYGNTPVRLVISAIKPGQLRSIANIYDFTVINITEQFDQALVNNDYKSHSLYNDGMVF